MSLPTETLPPYYMQGNAAVALNRITSTGRPLLVLVTHADPNFARDKHHEIEYELSGRRFYADRSKRGAYADYCGAVGWAKRAEQSAARVPTMMDGMSKQMVGTAAFARGYGGLSPPDGIPHARVSAAGP